jgi:hypothetical protein
MQLKPALAPEEWNVYRTRQAIVLSFGGATYGICRSSEAGNPGATISINIPRLRRCRCREFSSDIAGRRFLFLAALFKEEVNQLGRRVVHFSFELVHLTGEVFEQPGHGHSHGESEPRG